EWRADIDHRRSTGRHRRRLRLRWSLTLAPFHQSPAAFGRAERGHDENRHGGIVGRRPRCPQQVAPVGRAERPRQLDLHESEQRLDGAQLRAFVYPVLIAYLLGVVGMVGSGIWLMWLISLIHCPGLRIWVIWCASFLLAPNWGV